MKNKQLFFFILVILFGMGMTAGCAPKPGAAEGLESIPTASPVARTTTTVIASPTAVLPTSTEILESIATPVPTPIPAISAPSPTPTPDPCWQEGGKIEQHLLYTDSASLPWEFRVYTPPCYDQNPEQIYPFLVLIHGSTFNDDQWDRLGADETADLLIANGEIPPFILLMPRDRVWKDPPDDPFDEAFLQDMIPWMEDNYRISSDREDRAIGGLSRGGAWAINLGISHWWLFGHIGGHSTFYFQSDSSKIRAWLRAIPEDKRPRIRLDIGDKDYLLAPALQLETVLTEENIPHEWFMFSGRHEEAYWSAHIEQYLRWYTAEWPFPYEDSP